MKSSSESDSLFVIIHSPEGIMFQGVCSALSAVNLIGPFDILPNHQNFITHINSTVTLYLADSDEKQEIPVQMGVLRVQSNEIVLYVIMSPLLTQSDR
ncbi:MAG: hypothetical protein M3Q44_05605 [bacterium]|nr:hypothetical protein [bacterium]